MKAYKLGFFVLLSMFLSCGPTQTKTETADENVQEETEKGKIKPNKEKDAALLPTVNIQPNQKISSPLKIKVNSEGIWFASEGELGIVRLLDSDGNELAQGILSADEEWMKEGPVMFSTELNFDSKKAEKAKLIIHNNPGGGDGDEAGEKKSFEIPVILED